MTDLEVVGVILSMFATAGFIAYTIWLLMILVFGDKQ